MGPGTTIAFKWRDRAYGKPHLANRAPLNRLADLLGLVRPEISLKILLIAWYFPPSNTIAAVRLGQLAKFLKKSGHEVRVLSARDLPYAPTLPVEIPEDCIHRTGWTNINALGP